MSLKHENWKKKKNDCELNAVTSGVGLYYKLYIKAKTKRFAQNMTIFESPEIFARNYDKKCQITTFGDHCTKLFLNKSWALPRPPQQKQQQNNKQQQQKKQEPQHTDDKHWSDLVCRDCLGLFKINMCTIGEISGPGAIAV